MIALDRRIRRITIALLVILLVTGLVVAAFPWGLSRGLLARALTERFGRPVTIAGLERVDQFGFTPTLRLRDLRVPQARWAGSGDLARIDRAEATFSVLPLLLGRFRPRDIRIDGVSLALVRRADGTTNWSRPGESSSGNAAGELGLLRISRGRIMYRDAKRQRAANLRFSSDDHRGVRAAGTGLVRNTPVAITLAAATVGRSGPWPFRAQIAGEALTMTATGTMDHPLDTDAMSLDVTARAADLRLVDAIIEAGLFGTRPVVLAAHVRHDAPRWTIDRLRGSVGGSDLAGRATVTKVDGRSKIEGTLVSRRFDVNDLSSAEGRAAAHALTARIGPRVVPDTRINLARVGRTDGRIAFRLGEVLSGGDPTLIRNASGTLSIDHRLVRLAPFAATFAGGRLRGGMTIDQQGARRTPRLLVDLAVDGASLAAIAGGSTGLSGRTAIRARFAGSGDTIRSAVGRSSGRLALVAEGGRLPERYAAAIGFDAGRALLDGNDDPARLRCLVAAFRLRGGTGAASPMVVDTSQSQLRGVGTLSFPAETLAIRLTGAPKQRAILRVPGSATLSGSLRAPQLVVPKGTKSAGSILKAIGRAISGRTSPLATDADCARLAVEALS